MSSRKWVVVGCLLALGLLLAACGGSDSSSSSSSSTSESTEAPAETENTGQGEGEEQKEEGGGEEATGKPIKFGSITFTFLSEQVFAGLDAAAEEINENGGVNGRPLELESCEESSGATATRCVNELTGNSEVLAFVGNGTNYGGNVNPVAVKAGMALIASEMYTAPDFETPNQFALGGGAFIGVGGCAPILYEVVNTPKIGIAVQDVPAAAALPGIIDETILGPRNAKLAAESIIPEEAADLTSQVSKLEGTESMILNLSTQTGARVAQTARQIGYKGPLCGPAGSYGPESVEELFGDATDELYISSDYNLDSEGYEMFMEDMEKFAPGVPRTNEALNSWIGVKLLADVLEEEGGEPTRESILKAFEGLKNPNTYGLTKPLDFSNKGTALGGTSPNIRPEIQWAWPLKYENGAFVAVQPEPVPLFEAPKG